MNIMKKGVLYFAIFLISMSLQAQTPEKFSYQMLVRDAENNILSNANIGLRVSIVQGNESGSITYSETHSTSTSKSGFVSVVIGAGATTDNFSDIDWSMAPFFVKAEIDPTGATSYSLTSINELQSVPFALHAKTTETLVLPEGYLLVGNSSNQATSVAMTGDVTIANTGSVVIGSDKVSSAQVIDNSLLADDLATGSVASDEILDGTIRDEDLNKSAVPLSGFGDPTASLDYGGQLLSNVRDPNSAQELATKAYVDILELKIQKLMDDLGIVLPGTYAVGDAALGGIVGYILQVGDPGYNQNVQHGIIVALEDQSTSATWGCFGSTVSGANGILLGKGDDNTLDILAGCGTAGIAARLCADLVVDDYSDWHLPSPNEMIKLFSNKTTINSSASSNGGSAFVDTNYSTSYQNGEQEHGLVNMSTGYFDYHGFKNLNYHVRAVRFF
ncbi:MAG: hypothetical protein RIB71_16800 [Imperialibacter sp.]|uniref:hypothetical protein n=1 Tax=Imperialibacter sp. TaxID=2038411 RepID=UPI0032EDDE5A